MGQAIVAAAKADPDTVIAAECSRGQAIESAVARYDVVIDVSHPDATQQICAACLHERKPLVIGTTGHSPSQRKVIDATARAVPIVLAPNFSIGVNTLFSLALWAAQLLGPEFDAEIVETHHRSKKDAPSGTAKRLAEIICKERGLEYDKNVAHGRQGTGAGRPAEEIGMHSIRAGDVVGEHTLVLAGRGERLELTHKASSRQAFAVGALRAARWVLGRPAGIYAMEDVLDLHKTT